MGSSYAIFCRWPCCADEPSGIDPIHLKRDRNVSISTFWHKVAAKGEQADLTAMSLYKVVRVPFELRRLILAF